jgi:hypothetical protein
MFTEEEDFALWELEYQLDMIVVEVPHPLYDQDQ